jgi:hypothetical protein
MSEFEQDPSANTGRFRAFVERGEEDTSRAGRSPLSAAMPIVAGVAVIVVIVVIIVMVAMA